MRLSISKFSSPLGGSISNQFNLVSSLMNSFSSPLGGSISNLSNYDDDEKRNKVFVSSRRIYIKSVLRNVERKVVNVFVSSRRIYIKSLVLLYAGAY